MSKIDLGLELEDVLLVVFCEPSACPFLKRCVDLVHTEGVGYVP